MTSTEQARRKYDQLADRYEEIFFYVADVGRRLVDFADPASGTRVLDVGAGRGAVARAALARGCAVTAVDASEVMVQRLAADHPDIAAHQMDAARLGFPDASFQLVTAGFVIQILPDPAAALAEFRRVLAPAGTIALSLETQTPGRLQWLHDLNAEFFGAPPPDAPGPMTHEQLDALLRAAGFTDLTKTPVTVAHPLPDPAALWDWLGPRGLADAVRRLPPTRAADFHRAFLDGARSMDSAGGITLDFAATLHRARVAPEPGPPETAVN